MSQNENPSVAYFSMEVGLDPSIPTYSGGLGVLAGDTLRSCADLGLPVTGVTLVHRKGYFRQRIAEGGVQEEAPNPWKPEAALEPVDARVEVRIGGRTVLLGAWRYRIIGCEGHEVPVLLLDANLPENAPDDRALTDHLYGGDDAYRLAQEAILGVGGVRMLRALGLAPADCYHLNEGHAALAIPELLRSDPAPTHDSADDPKAGAAAAALERVRARCVFTTHTPVPAGHDRFPAALVRRLVEPELCDLLQELDVNGELNMTRLALEGARFVNGVAMRHGEVSREMFPGYPIRSITNGVHPETWAAPAFGKLFDRHIPRWRSDPFSLRCLTAVEASEVEAAHRDAKAALIECVADTAGVALDLDVFTLAFARRSTAYKRPLLVLRDLERLAALAREHGPIQLLFAGKAHPRDEEGRTAVREIHRIAEDLASRSGDVKVVFLPGYDMNVCGHLVAGADVWLNTPIPPLEASGTSGMKAALNGVPSLSILDGWWVEGCLEGVTGWAIGADGDEQGVDPESLDRIHAASLYQKLDDAVLPGFYGDPNGFAEMRRHTIALNGAHFHSHRMVLQYLFEAYRQTGPSAFTVMD